jgi:hypothetical protein
LREKKITKMEMKISSIYRYSPSSLIFLAISIPAPLSSCQTKNPAAHPVDIFPPTYSDLCSHRSIFLIFFSRTAILLPGPSSSSASGAALPAASPSLVLLQSRPPTPQPISLRAILPPVLPARVVNSLPWTRAELLARVSGAQPTSSSPFSLMARPSTAPAPCRVPAQTTLLLRPVPARWSSCARRIPARGASSCSAHRSRPALPAIFLFPTTGSTARPPSSAMATAPWSPAHRGASFLPLPWRLPWIPPLLGRLPGVQVRTPLQPSPFSLL